MAKKTSTKAKSADTNKKRTVAKNVTSKKRVNQKKPVQQQEFFEVRITQETLHWVIFGAVCVAFALWLFTLDTKVRDLYDQVDKSIYSTDIVNEKAESTHPENSSEESSEDPQASEE
jgi:beta-lactamase regulating signal transducer with metallopeptidase domain